MKIIKSTGIFNLQKKKKRKLCSKLEEDQHTDHIFQNLLKCKFSQRAKHGKLISNLQMDKPFSLPQQGQSQLPGNRSKQEGWIYDSVSLLQGNRASTSWIRALKINRGKRNLSTSRIILAWNIFDCVIVFINFVIIYWRTKTSRWKRCHPTAGPRIKIIYIFVAFGYQLLFTTCMWN